MNQQFLKMVFVLTIAASCLCAGCNNGPPKPEGMPALYPCQIKITQGGQPLDDALVRLVPDGDTAFQWTIAGKTDKSGVAKMITHGNYAGAPEGTFKVCVSKVEITPSQFPEPAKGAPSAERDAWREKFEFEKRPQYNVVKPEFDSVAATPHSITISKGKSSETFDVGEAVKIEIK